GAVCCSVRSVSVIAVPFAVACTAARIVLSVPGVVAGRLGGRLGGRLARTLRGGLGGRLRGVLRGGLGGFLRGLRAGGDDDRHRGAALDLLVRGRLGADHAALLDGVRVLAGGGVAEAGLPERLVGVGERLPGDVRDGDGALRGGDHEADRGADRLGAAGRGRLLEHRAGIVIAVRTLGALHLEADVLEGRGGAVEIGEHHVGHGVAAGGVPDLDLVALLRGAAGGRVRAGDEPALGVLLVLAVHVAGDEAGIL